MAAAGGGDWGFIITMVIIFVIFYFLLIRPQQKKQKELKAMLDNLAYGDMVMTTGGIHGKITGLSRCSHHFGNCRQSKNQSRAKRYWSSSSEIGISGSDIFDKVIV